MPRKDELEEWEQIQARTFTRWVNAQLRKRGKKIDSLFKDFADGINLINLYEVISDEELGKYNKNPRFQIHKLANLNTVISEINKFVDSVGIKLQFAAEQVNAGEKRTILGMIWVLIHKFEIQDISEEELSAREGLLLWCKKKTKGYNGVNVKNFNTSWQDGLAFCALIHKHHPNLMDYDSLEKKNAKENLQLAFDVAEKEFDIPQLLDANDMISYKPDDKSVMTYVAYYWKKFAASNKEKKAARKIARVAKNQRDNQQLAHDYEERAKKLKAWIAENDEKLKDTSNFGNDLESVQKVAQSFNDFKKKTKPEKSIEKSDLALMLTNLQNKQKNERVTVYVPPEELSTKAIQEVWDELENKQKNYDKALREAIKRMKYLEMCLARFRSRSKKILNWQQEKEAFVNKKIDESEYLTKLRANLKMHEAFEDEKKSVNATLQSTNELGKEIVDSGHSASQEVTDTMEKMKQGDEKLEQDGQKSKEKLVALVKYKQEIEDWSLQFAKKGEQLSLFLEDADLVLTEPVKASSVKDVEDAQEVVNKLVETHKANKELVDELNQLNKKITDAGADSTVYSRHNIDGLSNKYNDIGERLQGRTKELEDEKKVQEKNDELIQQFTNSAEKYKQYCDEQFKLITKDREGELEEQLKSLQEDGKKAMDGVSQQLEQLRTIYNDLEKADIAEMTDTTIQEMEVLEQQIKNSYDKRTQGIEQDIYAQKLSSVSEEQLKDFHETFQHFDKNKNQKLSKTEFKAACASIGEDIEEKELDAVFKKFDKDGDGFISFEEYIGFMSEVVKEGTSYDDVVESFKSLAGGNNVITENQIRSNMDKEDADYLISVMPQVEGGYDYKAYAKQTYGKE